MYSGFIHIWHFSLQARLTTCAASQASPGVAVVSFAAAACRCPIGISAGGAPPSSLLSLLLDATFPLDVPLSTAHKSFNATVSMSDSQPDATGKKMTDALEESKMPQTSAAEPPKIETEDVQAELRKLRADKKEQAQKVGKLESAVDVEIDVATSLSKHLQHCVKRDKSHQKDVMERIAAVNKALDDFPKIESMPEIEAFETKTLSELTDSDSAGELIDDLRKRISDLESMIKRLATTAGIAVDETKQDMEYLAELVQESTENFLFIKHQLASMKVD
ncbi:hypothetical protein IWX90DRAFT_233947 [Phyllosticta citrichinensis]|uniref:Uncharacterized protein n=1 Tax=Phyllosticta citrichinensis TaxID=1130410 RepID=A0ABR1XUW6_9PEZI